MSRLRGALFGCGMISQYHLAAWNRLPEVQIVALGSRTRASAEKRRDELVPDARVYTQLEAMLAEERLDFIDILTPPELHLDHCLTAQKADIHIICQKPLCADLDEARRLVTAVEGSKKIFAVHENHRYRPWFQLIRQRLAEGFFGTPHWLSLEHFEPRAPAEAYKTDMPKAVLLEYGTHLVDMARALFGEPSQVFARTHHLNPKYAVRASRTSPSSIRGRRPRSTSPGKAVESCTAVAGSSATRGKRTTRGR